MKRLITVILSLIFLFTACTPFYAYAAVAEEETSTTVQEEETTEASELETTTEPKKKKEKKETKVSGIEYKLNEAYELPLEMSVKIYPANPKRTVLLQRYISSEKKYVTVKKYKTKQAKKAKVKLTFPKKYRKKTTGKWRIVVNASSKAKKYVSKPITVTTRNFYPLYLNAKAGCVYCVETGQVLYGKEMYSLRKQASTTKIMTAVLLIESGRLGGNVKISKKAANTPYGNVYMSPGDVYRLKDMLYAMMLPSSNDCASAIAEGVSGTQKKFVKQMNEKAEELELKNTVFTNPHGLDENDNHTPAYELARLMAYASQYDEFMKVIGTAEYSFYSIKYRHHKIVKSTDKLKTYSKRHLGGKTGFTSGAQYCFASLYKYKGKHYAVCVMGNDNVSYRWKDMKKMYKYINKNANKKY